MSRNRVLIGSLSIMTMLFLIGPGFSRAASDDFEVDREVSVSDGQDSFHAVSSSAGYKVNDRFDLMFSDGSLTLWYAQNATALSSPSWEFELQFERLVEFQDDGNGRFDAGDIIASSMDLTERSYSMTYSTVSLPMGGNETTITAVCDGGVLTLVFVITTSAAYADTVPISPGEVKLGIMIHGYEFVGENTKLGLEMSINVDPGSALAYEELDDSAQLNITKSTMGGFFRWTDTALVDGVVAPVNASLTADTLTLSYPRGESIVHDPVLGVRSVAPLSGPVAKVGIAGNVLMYFVGVAFATAAVLAAVATRRSKNH